MLSNNKKIATLFTSLLFSLLSINCHAQTPVVSCPATFTDKHAVYRLFNAKLFNGPLSERMNLVPEIKKEKAIWDIDPRMDPYLVCEYAGTRHYIVFYAKGATYCEKNDAPVQAKCMS
ncbi:STY0301 family protein [Snodgrassella alvi]|uniref:STY0301 family protein n=1 Tax=Snodgrassella alvi TaxID=1196083 RepID=UPI00117B951F|nr:STY0301 family protein [Snodgrassella alvi]